MERKEPTKSPTMQDVKAEMEGSDTYTKIFPEIHTQVILISYLLSQWEWLSNVHLAKNSTSKL